MPENAYEEVRVERVGRLAYTTVGHLAHDDRSNRL